MTWLLGKLCVPFEAASQKYSQEAQMYINQAKEKLNSASSTSSDLLKQFRSWRDMTSMFDASGVGATMQALSAMADPKVMVSIQSDAGAVYKVAVIM